MAKAAADERARLEAQATSLEAQARDIEAVREKRMAEMIKEVSAARRAAMDALSAELAAERQKARQSIEQEILRQRQSLAHGARKQAAQYVGDYLKRLAGPSLEAAVISMFVADLTVADVAWNADPPSSVSREAGPNGLLAAEAATAFPTTEAQRHEVEAVIRERLGQEWKLSWTLDPSVISGIRLHLPGHQLEISLARGLEGFVGTADAAGVSS